MDELNLQEIEKKLNTEYQNGQRMVFWYDAEASFEEEVDQLNLPDVQIVHLTDRNTFRVKLLLEHEEPEKKFLVYAPFEKPDFSVNHLEDTLRYSREFFADKLSLIAAEVKAPARLRTTFEGLKEFFNIGKGKLTVAQKKAANVRINDFIERCRDFNMAAADEDLVMLVAMCVVAKARNTTVDDLYYAVFSYGDVETQQIIEKFSGFGLEKAFWKLTEQRFGYDDPKPTLLKFVMSLFAVYSFREDLDEAPADWKIFMQDKLKRQSSNISVLLENMMNNVIYQEHFDDLSEMVAEKLNVINVLEKTPLECLVHMGTFQAVDDVIIRWMIERITAEDKNASIDGYSIVQLCDMREKMHFGQRYMAEYQVIRSARNLLDAVGYLPEDDLSAQIKAYTENNYRIDMEYRHFIAAYDQMEDTTVFEDMKELIQNIYSTEYLEKSTYSWSVAYEKNEQQEIIPLQRDFYEDEVKSVKEKVVVIISDAFRFEAAKELEALFAEDQNCTVSMKVKMGTLPAVTAVGMAELLPHKTISMTEDKPFKIRIDGKSCGTTAQREQILQCANPRSAAIDFDSINQMKTSELRSFTSGKEVIYVYHNRVDATGEALPTEDSVFAAVNDSIREIFKLVKTLSKSGNVYRFLITADHGFIYTRRPLEATDKLENEAEKEALTDRRFIISKSNLSRIGTYAVLLGAALKSEDKRYINLAKGMSVFKCGGGMNYVHGGSSPQELLIPTLFIKTQRGVVDTEDAVINLISDIRKVTNLRIRLDFYQEKPVSDIVKATTYRIHFVSNDGEMISNEVIYKADHKEEKAGDRIVTLGFDIKKKNYDSMLYIPTIHEDVNHCKSDKDAYVNYETEYRQLEEQILATQTTLEEENSKMYSREVRQAIQYLYDNIAKYEIPNVFRLIFDQAVSTYMVENKMKAPSGKYYRYTLYAELLFSMRYFGEVHGTTKFMCVDEGQDLALNEYRLLYDLNGRNMVINIFGDTNQLIKPGRGISDWDELKKFFHANQFVLNENYRNTNQITRFCNDSFDMAVLQTGVDGAAVREIPRKDLEQEISFMVLNMERVAIIVPRQIQKRSYLKMDAILSERRHLIGDKMESGYITVAYVDEVKGIEFDRVFVVANGMTKNEKYIAYTRALSELVLVVDESITVSDNSKRAKNGRYNLEGRNDG